MSRPARPPDGLVIPGCPRCGGTPALDLFQPFLDLPGQILGACPSCGGLFGAVPLPGEAGWTIAGPADRVAAG